MAITAISTTKPTEDITRLITDGVIVLSATIHQHSDIGVTDAPTESSACVKINMNELHLLVSQPTVTQLSLRTRSVTLHFTLQHPYYPPLAFQFLVSSLEEGS